MENMEAAFEKGYADTEDEISPFWGATRLEGPQDQDEEPLGTVSPVFAGDTKEEAKTDGNDSNGGGTITTTTATTMEKIVSRKGKWIDIELKLRLLSTCGIKAVKAKRLYDGWRLRWFNTEEELAGAKAKAPKKKRVITGLKTFPSSAKWQQLFPSATAVQEPTNPTF